MSQRKIFVVALSVCLIATLSFGTLAWFTAEDQVTNNFYVGDTNTGADEVFGIDLWENRDVNGDGDYNEKEDAERAEGLTYKTILPGERLSKEPHLENTGIHPQYVRAIVTVTEADILKVAMTPKDSEVSVWEDVKLFLPGTSDKWELEKFRQQFTHLHITSNPLFYLFSRTSYSFILHQGKNKIVVKLLSLQLFCCQELHREPFSKDVQLR